jgi:hypothetical protein
MKKLLIMLIAWAFVCLGFCPNASAQANEFRRFDINWNVLSWSRQGGLNQYGGTLGFTAHINERWGIVADVGVHEPSGIDLRTTTYRFGPKISQRYGERVTTFGQFLAGGVTFTDDASTAKINGFSMLIGGGVDIGIRPWFAIRAIEGGYSGFHAVDEWSNGIRLSGGIVFRFGQ